jgi:signal transduction histidine kinase/CheY-like chemotaxis protein
MTAEIGHRTLVESIVPSADVLNLLSAIPVPAALLDAGLRYRFVNAPFAELHNAAPADLEGTSIGEIAGTKNVAKLTPHIDRARAGERVAIETTWTLPSRGARVLALTLAPSSGTAAHDAGVFMFVEDLTDDLRSQAELLHASKMDAIGQLTGGIAHDFNNLLTIVSGNLEFLRSELDPAATADLREALDDSQSAARQGADLTEQLLAFACKQDLRPVVLDVASVVEKGVRLLRRTLGRHISVHLAIEEALPLARIDRTKLETAIVNLAINARDAMPDGGRLTISAKAIDASTATPTTKPLGSGSYVEIAVTDSGTGMDGEAAAHAFEPFYTTKEPGAGTGLGLSMVYGFARQSGGDVALDTELERGTTVRIYLPALESDSSLATPGQTRAPALDHSGGTVLLVEDEERVRRLAAREMRRLGYSVVEAEGAGEALSLLSAGTPVDLVFSDVVMPGQLDGIGLAREVQQRWPALPVVLATGYTDRATELSDLVLLKKPFTFAELSAVLRDALNSSPLGSDRKVDCLSKTEAN